MSKQLKPRVFIDVNVALDLLLHRLPFFRETTQLMTLAHHKHIIVGVSAAAFPFAYFHLRKATGDAALAREKLVQLSSVLELVAITEEIVRSALEQDLPEDLEDGVQLAAATAFQADMIVTRDKSGFRTADIPVHSPSAFLRYYQQHYL